MKAVRLLEYGGQLVLDEVPAPAIARDEILVKIKSTAVNHLDLVKASGAARQILPIDLPWIDRLTGEHHRLLVFQRSPRTIDQGCSGAGYLVEHLPRPPPCLD